MRMQKGGLDWLKIEKFEMLWFTPQAFMNSIQLKFESIAVGFDWKLTQRFLLI